MTTRPRQLLAQHPPDYQNEDSDFGLDWDMFLEDVEENVLKPCMPEIGEWIVVIATNIGWRNHTGWRIFRLDDVQDFVRKVSGFDCDQTIEFYVDETMQVTARISHHDSPTGEGRSIVSLKEWIAREIKDISLDDLHDNLMWIEAEEDAQGYKLPEDNYLWEVYTKYKSKDDLTKEDYVEIYHAYFDEDFISDVDIFNLEGFIYRNI